MELAMRDRCPVRTCALLLLTFTQSLWASDLVSFESIHNFNQPAGDGEYLNEPVTEGNDGLLYGATRGGGAYNSGLVFRLEKSGANYQILHAFDPSSPTNGSAPWGGVVEGRDGRLYGATRYGGADGAGTVYSLARDGGGFRILHAFSTNGWSGRYPMNSVIQAKDGRLYGRTLSGGEANGATIFALNTDGSGFQILHSFERSDIENYIAFSGLLEASDGLLYGTANREGPNRAGFIFRLHTDGSSFETLHFFTGTGKGPEGRAPDAGVTESSEGVLFGTTEGGGFDDFGVLYRINRDGTDYRILYEFTAQRAEGYAPSSPPTEGPDGALYGTTYYGGPDDNGAIYRVHKDGTGMTFLYTFGDVNCPAWPYSALKLCRDGAFYGTTYNGRGDVYGAVFRINPISLVVTATAVRLHAMIGQTYAFETVDQLGGTWTEVGRSTNTTGTLEFLLPAGDSPRFFRARLVQP
jgi:uncharacterized repeat protein (TIGR03803 family)